MAARSSARSEAPVAAIARHHLWLIFWIALSLRVTYISFCDNSSLANWADQGGDIALGLLRGDGYQATDSLCHGFRSFRVPGLPLTLYAIWFLFGVNVVAAKVAMAAISSATAVTLALLSSRLFGPLVGRLAGAAGACYPPFIYWTGTLGPETLTTALMVASVLGLTLGHEKRGYLFAGICLGVLALTRALWLPYLLLVLLFVGWRAWRERDTRAIAMLALPAIFLLALWVGYNWRTHGRFLLTSTESGKTFLECHNPVSFGRKDGTFAEWIQDYAASLPDVREKAATLSEIELDRYMFRKGLAFVVAHPREYATAFLYRIEYLWRPLPRFGGHELQTPHFVLMALTFVPLLGLSLFAIGRLRLWRDPRHAPIFLAFVCVTLMAGLFRGCIRYRAPVEPFILSYAAAGALLARPRRRDPRRMVDSAMSEEAILAAPGVW